MGGYYKPEIRHKRYLRNRNRCPICGRLKSQNSKRCLSCLTKLRNLKMITTGKPFKKGHIVSDIIRKKIRLAQIKNPVKYWLGKKRPDILGEKHFNWKGGISKLTNIIRNCFKYRRWRSDIFTRDNFTCQECFNRGGNLEAHHIKAFALIIIENNIKTLEEALNCEELWNINNGKTLCEKCHKKIKYLSKMRG